MLLGFSQTVARRFLIRSPGGALVRLMKFGKRFLAAQRAEYVYLDYKVRPTHLSFAAPSTRTRSIAPFNQSPGVVLSSTTVCHAGAEKGKHTERDR